MEKAKKAEVVEDLSGVFAKAGSVVVAHYSGMTVAQMADLRSRMRASGALQNRAFARAPPRRRGYDRGDQRDQNKKPGNDQAGVNAAECLRQPDIGGDAEKRERRR